MRESDYHFHYANQERNKLGDLLKINPPVKCVLSVWEYYFPRYVASCCQS